MFRIVSRASGALVVVAVVLSSASLRANESAPVVVMMGGSAELRVQVSEGLTAPCDSGSNRPLFDGRLKPGESFRTMIAGDCICERHTTAAFPASDWTTSGFKCRPRVCRGKSCRPAADPTIVLSLP